MTKQLRCSHCEVRWEVRRRALARKVQFVIYEEEHRVIFEMTIIVFLIDTSASMNQRAYLGGRPTLLDVAKGAVETFVKVSEEILRRIIFT